MSIRAATLADEQGVIGLWEACGLTRPWNDPGADFRRALASPSSIVLLDAGEQCGAPLATGMFGFDGHRGWVYYLAVAPAARGRGLGRTMLSEGLRWLSDLGCPKVELMVRETNPATAFYGHLGWQVEPVQVYSRWLDGKEA